MARHDPRMRQPLPLLPYPAHDGRSAMAPAGQPTLARTGKLGAAVERPRDAYRDVPILKRPTWGHLISAYFFFGGISSGAYTLGSLAMLCDGPRWTRLGRAAHLVALVSLVPCPPLLIADLGKPSRFQHMLRIFKPSSPMNLGAWALTAHGGFCTLTVLTRVAHERDLPVLGAVLSHVPERPLAIAGVPTALTLGGYTGVLLGTSSVPLWYTSPLLGALFMASSLSTGLAALSIASSLSGGGDRATRAVLGELASQLGAAELALLGGYLGTSGRAARPLLRGRHGRVLAGATAALGLATLVEGVRARQRRHGLLPGLAAAAATLLSGALLRAALVGAGSDSADDREGTLEAMRGTAKAPGWGLSVS